MTTPPSRQSLVSALPAMREYIIRTWWETREPVQASKGDTEVRTRAHLEAGSNPSGWWGRAWTAVEKYERGEETGDRWMISKFGRLFVGLGRVADSEPYSYFVDNPTECPGPQIELEEAASMSETGQGRPTTIEERRALEAAGMLAGRQWLHSQGFSDSDIKDTSATRPWDLEAERNGETWYVEAKGTSSDWSAGSTVILTAGEVRHAMEHRESCTLVIAASCVFSRGSDGQLVASPGDTVVFSPWHPSDSELRPLTYSHRPALQQKWPGP